jgi:hypothetical protein
MKRIKAKKEKEIEVKNYAFGEAIATIIKLYKDGNNEPLDGDEVDVLTEHLRNELNLFEGNITEEEYFELEAKMILNPTWQ